jgi:phenylalanyl-tRNA synthetase alpha chain
VELLSETAYTDLPSEVVKRLGCEPDQKNVLMRITLRHLEKTLTKDEANALYRRIYAEVNYGDGGYLSLPQ